MAIRPVTSAAPPASRIVRSEILNVAVLEDPLRDAARGTRLLLSVSAVEWVLREPVAQEPSEAREVAGDRQRR